MLLTNVTVLSQYDVPQPVLDLLSCSTVKHVSIIRRRGPLEAAFTMKELHEMINLPEASMVPLNPFLLATPPSNPPLTQQQSQLLQLLKQGSKNLSGIMSKTWSLHFFRSPPWVFMPNQHTNFYDPGLRHLRTLSGRVINTCDTTLKNVYASDWAATGAKGVLASTIWGCRYH